jgi:hypothetical protein
MDSSSTGQRILIEVPADFNRSPASVVAHFACIVKGAAGA